MMDWIFSNFLTIGIAYLVACAALFAGLIFFSETWPNDEVDH